MIVVAFTLKAASIPWRPKSLSEGETVLAAHNLGRTAVDATMAAPGATVEPLFADPGASLAKDGTGWWAHLPPQWSTLCVLARHVLAPTVRTRVIQLKR